MRELDSFFAQLIDIPLHHYTGVGSLLGIATSDSLWASHVYYLNDSKEILHACDILQSAIQPRIAFGGLTPEEIDFAEQFLTWAKSFNGERYNLFVFSLSEERSLLSQWRSYTPHGKGVSIEFSPQLVQRLANENNLRIARCLYDPHEHDALLMSLFEKMLLTFRRLRPTRNINGYGLESCYYEFIEAFRNDVFQVLALIKHPAFAEEREWRLISKYFDRYTVPEIHFREGASMLVPYIKLSLGAARPVFESITLGPSQNAELSFSALHMFLANSQLCLHTRNSNIPYREW